jgi:hypothetical protein
MTTSLTKQQAYEEMLKGNKMSHQYFDDSEYIHIVDGKMLTEDGYRFEQGWVDRKEDYWLDGWRIFNKERQNGHS